jgi:hypothetical protein
LFHGRIETAVKCRHRVDRLVLVDALGIKLLAKEMLPRLKEVAPVTAG